MIRRPAFASSPQVLAAAQLGNEAAGFARCKLRVPPVVVYHGRPSRCRVVSVCLGRSLLPGTLGGQDSPRSAGSYVGATVAAWLGQPDAPT
jgi:hypothetical protein